MLASAVHLPLTASDDDLIQFVDGGARLMEIEDYASAFQYTAQDTYMHWTPDLIREAVKTYGRGDSRQRVTLHGKATDVQQRREVTRWGDGGLAGIGAYDLYIDGYVSDLTATFVIQASVNGLTVVLQDIHVM